MTETVNLNRVRKERARKESASRAAENRVRFGRSKAEKAAEATERGRLERFLEGRKLQGDGTGGEG